MGSSLTTNVRLAIKGDAAGGINALRGFKREVGGAQSGMGKWAGAAKMAGVAIAAGIGLAIGAMYKVGRALYDVGAEWKGMSNAIRIGTGATGTALKKLEKDAGAIAKNTAASLDDIGTAVATINTRLGLTGEPLQTLSKQFLDFSKLTGGEVHDDIRNLTRLFGDWGIKTEDYGDTLDMVFRTLQSTDVAAADLTRTVVDNGATLRQMGYSFRDSITMLGKWEMEGVNVSKMVMGLGQANKYFTKENKDAAVGLRETIAAIRDSNEIEAKAIAVKVFGVRAAADMTAAIREERFEWGDLKKDIVAGTDTIAKATADTMSLPEKWQIFRNKMAVKLQPIASKLFSKVEEGFDRVMGWIDNNEEGIDNFFDGLADSAGTALEVVAELLGVAGELAKIYADLSGIADASNDVAQAQKLLNDRLAKGFWFNWDNWGRSKDAVQAVVDALDVDPDAIGSLQDAETAVADLANARLLVESLRAQDLISDEEADAALAAIDNLKLDVTGSWAKFGSSFSAKTEGFGDDAGRRMGKKFAARSKTAGTTGKQNLTDAFGKPVFPFKVKGKDIEQSAEDAKKKVKEAFKDAFGYTIKINFGSGAGSGAGLADTFGGLQGQLNGMRAVANARSLIGSPYVLGASGPSAFDCSGFVKYVFNRSGLPGFPTFTGAQYPLGQKFSGPARPGDLIFFRGGRYQDSFGFGHVGIYDGAGGYIHASSPGVGVIHSSLSGKSNYVMRRYFAAAGADFITQGPTMVIAGEAGRAEHVKVTPAPIQPRGGDGVYVSVPINAPVYGVDDLVGIIASAVSAGVRAAPGTSTRRIVTSLAGQIRRGR